MNSEIKKRLLLASIIFGTSIFIAILFIPKSPQTIVIDHSEPEDQNPFFYEKIGVPIKAPQGPLGSAAKLSKFTLEIKVAQSKIEAEKMKVVFNIFIKNSLIILNPFTMILKRVN